MRHWIGIVAMVVVGCAASDAPVDATATADGTATDLGNEEESATPDVDASPDAPVEASHAPRTLQFVELVDDLNEPTQGSSSATFSLNWDSSRDLKVRLVEGASPVAGVPVRFERLDDTLSATQLASPTIATDDAGVATDAITALREVLAEVQVRVTVDSDDTVAPLTFKVTLRSLPPPLLTIGFADYQGAWPLLDAAEVRVYRQAADGKPGCAELSVDQIASTQATLTSPTLNLKTSYTFLNLPGLSKDLAQQYTIVALARHGQGPTEAWACNDKDGHVTWTGGVVYVELTLVDLPACDALVDGVCDNPLLSCQGCPVGGVSAAESHLCTTPCKADADCPDAARPKCSQAGTGQPGMCTPQDFGCCWLCA